MGTTTDATTDKEKEPEEWIISEAEQRRIIDETGILTAKPSSLRARNPGKKPLIDFNDEVDYSKIRAKEGNSENNEEEEEEEEEEEQVELGEELFTTFLWLIIFTFLFIGLDFAVHAQYSEDVTWKQELHRLRSIVPCLAGIIFTSQHYSSHPITKLFLFGYSLIGGSGMIHTVNNQGYLIVMQRGPPMGVLWIWSIVQLDLVPACLSLVGVAGYVWWTQSKVIS